MKDQAELEKAAEKYISDKKIEMPINGETRLSYILQDFTDRWQQSQQQAEVLKDFFDAGYGYRTSLLPEVNYAAPDFKTFLSEYEPEQSQQVLIEGYKKLLVIANCPQILIDNPFLLNGKEPTEKDIEWAKKSIVNFESQQQVSDDPVIPRCGICGGKQVVIRGRYPKQPDRATCPTCSQEKLDQISEISSSYYGKAMQLKS